MISINTSPGETLTTKCKCGQSISGPFPPIIVTHSPLADNISIPHIEPVECTNCHTFYYPVVTTYNISIGLIEEPKIETNYDKKISLATNISNILKNNIT